VRKLPALIAAAGLLVTLSACAGGPASIDGCSPTYATGSEAALVTADGAFGANPKAEFPTPLVAKSPQVSVVSAADGARVNDGDTAVVQVTIYDATSGRTLISTDYTGEGLTLLAVKGEPAFGAVTQCATVGSRVAAVGPAGDLLGDTAIEANKLPVAPDDTIVLVVDVNAKYLGKANGADQLPQAGFPAIVLAPDGRPGFTFPTPEIPKDLKIATLKAGDGATVKEGDTVVVNYTGVLWDTKKVFDSTWDRNAPAMLLAKDSTKSGDGSGVVPGFAQALIGAKVGSQVIVVIPPEFGYPAGSAPASVPDGSTMVFVIDVLGIQ
jgi:peptidylprolyl isomerase